MSGVARVTRVARVARLAKGGKGDEGGKGSNVTKADLIGKICNGYQGSKESECG